MRSPLGLLFLDEAPFFAGLFTASGSAFVLRDPSRLLKPWALLQPRLVENLSYVVVGAVFCRWSRHETQGRPDEQ